MKMFNFLLSAVLLLGAASWGASASQQLPVYFHARLAIEDQDKFFKEYVPEVKKHVKAGNGRVLFSGFKPKEQLEGEASKFWTVLIMFPSKADFDRFYYSEGNQQIAIPIRYQATSVNNISLFEGATPLNVVEK